MSELVWRSACRSFRRCFRARPGLTASRRQKRTLLAIAQYEAGAIRRARGKTGFARNFSFSPRRSRSASRPNSPLGGSNVQRPLPLEHSRPPFRRFQFTAGRERPIAEDKAVKHAMIVTFTVHFEPERVRSRAEFQCADLDPDDEADIGFLVLGDVAGATALLKSNLIPENPTDGVDEIDEWRRSDCRVALAFT